MNMNHSSATRDFPIAPISFQVVKYHSFPQNNDSQTIDKSVIMDSPRSAPRSPLATPSKEKPAPSNGKAGTPLRPVEDVTADSDDDEDEGPSLETMRAFGRYVLSPHPSYTCLISYPNHFFLRQVQRAPTTGSSAGPAKIVIPKRGEKDFEPLYETVTIQEKMLRESRQALFDGLSGVRGTSRCVFLFLGADDAKSEYLFGSV
jgi:hypothetical protein